MRLEKTVEEMKKFIIEKKNNTPIDEWRLGQTYSTTHHSTQKANNREIIFIGNKTN